MEEPQQEIEEPKEENTIEKKDRGGVTAHTCLAKRTQRAPRGTVAYPPYNWGC